MPEARWQQAGSPVEFRAVMRKPAILTFVRYYLPGFKFGGPVRSIANMVDHLSGALDFWVVTSDRDALDVGPYPAIEVNSWNQVGGAKVYYAEPRSLSLRRVARLIGETDHDVLYLNSFFDPGFTGLPLLVQRLGWVPDRPVLIAPRGEFSPGAFALKRWKKYPYLALTRVAGICRSIMWQASSEHEVADIRRAMGPSAKHIHIAPNLPPRLITPQEDDFASCLGVNKPLRLVFLSRIASKKNLDFALRVLQRVGVSVDLHIYGPVWELDYWEKCQRLINSLPGHVQVKYCGEVPPDAVLQLLAAYDLFFFPTRGENFGHVILESLSAGTPVLISDQTPWRQDGSGACTVLPLGDEAPYVEAIERVASQTPQARRETRTAARHLAQTFAKDVRLVERNLALFLEAANGDRSCPRSAV